MEFNPVFQQFKKILLTDKLNRLNGLKAYLSCCLLCRNQCQHTPLLCKYCEQDLLTFDLSSLDNNLLNWPIIDQHIKHTHFQQLISLAPYTWPYNSWLYQLKYQGHFYLAKLFARLLTKSIRLFINQLSDKKIGLLSVPSHITRWQYRGYNQSHLIAKYIAQQCKLDYFPHLLLRTKATQQQVGLSGSARRQNLKKAFVINERNQCNLKNYHWLLFDDVVTTGATVDEASQALKQAGADNITVLSLALPNPKAF